MKRLAAISADPPIRDRICERAAVQNLDECADRTTA
jgi:hypothetical protein